MGLAGAVGPGVLLCHSLLPGSPFPWKPLWTWEVSPCCAEDFTSDYAKLTWSAWGYFPPCFSPMFSPTTAAVGCCTAIV